MNRAEVVAKMAMQAFLSKRTVVGGTLNDDEINKMIDGSIAMANLVYGRTIEQVTEPDLQGKIVVDLKELEEGDTMTLKADDGETWYLTKKEPKAEGSEFDDLPQLRTIIAHLVGTFRQVHGQQIDHGSIRRFSVDAHLTRGEIHVLEAFLDGRKVE